MAKEKTLRLPVDIEKELFEREYQLHKLYSDSQTPEEVLIEEEKIIQKLKNELSDSYEYYKYNPVPDDLIPQKEIKPQKDVHLMEAEKSIADPNALPGFDIDELKEDKLHNLLINSKLYKLYYTVWRMKVSGNYRLIPIEFLTMISSFLLYDNKLNIISENFEHVRLNTIYLAISGAGKSLTYEIAKKYGERLQIPILKMSSMGTIANIRGTVKVEGYNPVIMPGVMKNALIYADEFSSVLKTFLKDENTSSFYLDILENDEIDAGTAESKKLITLLDNPKDAREKKIKDKLMREMEIYGWKYNSLQHRFVACNNSTLNFKGQPVTINSQQMDKQAQSYAMARGLFGRCLFFCETKIRKPDEKNRAEKERLKFIRDREKITGMKENEIIKTYIDDFVNLYNKLPKTKQMYITNVEISRNNLNYLFSNQDWQDLENLCYELKLEGHVLGNELEAQMNRYQYKHYSILAFLIGYLKQEEYPSSETWKQCSNIIVQSLYEFKHYLENSTESTIWTKRGQVKDYTKVILELLLKMYKKSKQYNKEESDDIQHYPNKRCFDKKFKEYFIAKVSDSFNKKTYEKAIKNLENFGSINVTNNNPETGKNFSKNVYKILLWDEDKNQPRKN